MERVAASVAVGLRLRATVAVAVGVGNEPGVLDFLIDGVLQQLLKLLHFGFDLGDVTEFDFNGGAEAVAAVLGQPEFFAVVGAEFDSHDGGPPWRVCWVVDCGGEEAATTPAN